MRTLIRFLTPYGLISGRRNYLRFRSLGYAVNQALTASGSLRRCNALTSSRLDLMPLWFRRELNLVVDIGANEGQWLHALKMVAEVKRAVSVEPNPGAFDKLRVKFRSDETITVHQLAVGEECGEKELNVTRSTDLASFLTPSQLAMEQYRRGAAEIDHKVAVNMTTLDRLLRGANVDLLKLDVQGYEIPVLRGATETLTRTKGILIETNFVSHYGGDSTFFELDATLRLAGFCLWSIADPYRGKDGQALWTDAFYLNEALGGVSG